MPNVALAAPTLTLGGFTPAAGLLGAGTSINGASPGITIAGNNGLLLLNIVTITSGSSTVVTVVAPNAANNVVIGTLAASSSYWFGPFDPSIFNWPTGSANPDLVVITGTFAAVANTAQVFYVSASKPPVSFLSLHNPFVQTVGSADQ